MKKTRHLRKSIQNILLYITITLFILWASINDYDISFIGVYVLGWIVIALNIYILYKYGNHKDFMDKE